LVNVFEENGKIVRWGRLFLAKKCLHGPPGAGHRVSQDAPPAPYPKTVIASFVSMSLEAILPTTSVRSCSRTVRKQLFWI
jgi:hypothetical protein